MIMTLAYGTYFQQYATIVVQEVVVASPNDNYAHLTFLMKFVEHVTYAVAVEHHEMVAAVSFVVVNVEQHYNETNNWILGQ